jgi:valyl-tRNA synthetase
MEGGVSRLSSSLHSCTTLTHSTRYRYQTRITNQICRLGVSCDWDRVAFTMNPALSTAVAETFVKLHDDGIIYRANRLVNWCVAMNTTLSNLEVS